MESVSISNCSIHLNYPTEYICIDQKCDYPVKKVCAKCHL